MKTSYCLFKVNQHLSAINADYLEEVFSLPELILVPNAPSGIIGVIDLHGDVLPVVDFRVNPEEQSRHYELADSLIILKQNDLKVGVIANEVQGVRDLSIQGTMTELPEHQAWMSSDTKGFFAGLLLNENNIFILNEPQAWFNPGELQQVIAVTRFLVDDFYDNRLDQNKTTLSAETIITAFCPDASAQEKSIFRQRADGLRQLPETIQANTALKTLIVVALDDCLIGIDATYVREFITVTQAIPVPCCPRYIVGNTNLRGEVVTVVDITEPLGFSAKTLSKNPMAVVVELENALAAVVIEEIRDALFELKPSAMETAVPPMMNHRFIQGMVPYGEQMMHILDIPTFFHSDELMVNETL
ncbi:MAG: chemotaxis protein CheW [Cyanobacteria bacterium P01_D01_bin.156]